MPNFFTDNKDLLFQFERLNLKEVVQIAENNYEESKKFPYAPVDLKMLWKITERFLK